MTLKNSQRALRTYCTMNEFSSMQAPPPQSAPSHAPQLFGVPLSVCLGPNRKIYSAYGTPIIFAPPTPLSSLGTSVHALPRPSGVRTLHGSRLDRDSEKPAKRILAYTSCAKRKDEIEMIFLEVWG